MDLFADALRVFFEKGKARLTYERDDGFRDTEDLSWYLASYRSFPRFEKEALAFARGRVLDIGSGAGRHALYLQRHERSVVCIDSSPKLVALARKRGVRDAREGNACDRLPFRDAEFDTVLLFGNNLGICGTIPRFRRMLRELHRVTSQHGLIIATTRLPPDMEEPDRGYMRRNIALGRAPGQLRLRLHFGRRRGAWFDLLLFSPADLAELASRAGWKISHLFTESDFEEGYSVVLAKSEA